MGLRFGRRGADQDEVHAVGGGINFDKKFYDEWDPDKAIDHPQGFDVQIGGRGDEFAVPAT